MRSYRRGQTDKQKAGAIATRDEVFLFLVLWQDGRGATIWTVVSAWNACRKQKISINMVGEPSIGERWPAQGRRGTRFGSGRSSEKVLQLVLEKIIFARAELQCGGTKGRIRGSGCIAGISRRPNNGLWRYKHWWSLSSGKLSEFKSTKDRDRRGTDCIGSAGNCTGEAIIAAVNIFCFVGYTERCSGDGWQKSTVEMSRQGGKGICNM